MSSALKINPAGLSPHSLEELRIQIDQVDKNLLDLIEKRAQLVARVGDYKKTHQLPAFDPVREEQIRLKIKDYNSTSSSISNYEMEQIFMTLVSQFRSFEGAHIQRQIAKELFDKSDLSFMNTHKIVIFGFGLLGSSFYLALQEFLPHWNFFVVDPYMNKTEFQNWRKKNQFNNIQLIKAEASHQSDVYVLAAPVEINMNYLATFPFRDQSLVFDLGSTKKNMCETFTHRQKNEKVSFTFVGGHPLAGKGRAGLKHSDALIFYNKVFCWVAAPFQTLSPSLKVTFDIFAMALGSKPYWLDPDEHDSTLAWTSHLPQIISSAVANCLNKKEFSNNPDLFPGFVRDILRAGGSSFSMWKSIFDSNASHISEALSDFILSLKEIEGNLEDPNFCKNLFQNSNDFYNQLQKLITKQETK